MKLRLNINTRKWFVACANGSPSGWSAWKEYPRLDALILIETGWSFETVG